MHPSLSYCRWSLVPFFHLLTYLLVAIGFTMLALAQQISPPVFVLFVLPFCGAFSSSVNQRLQLTAQQANLLTWLYLPFFLLDMLSLSRSFVPATLHLILFVQLLKIYQAKSNRDYSYLIILSFLQVLAASALTINVSFFICFLFFVLVCIAALICLEIKRSLEGSILPPEVHSIQNKKWDLCSERESTFGPTEQKKTIHSVFAVSVICLCLILCLGATLFFTIPRFGFGYFNRAVTQPVALSGFSDRIQLGSIGSIQLDSSVVMRVRVDGDPKRISGVKWRGVTLDHFDGRNWSKRVRGIASPISNQQAFKIRDSGSLGHLVGYQVLMEPCSTNYLFTLDRILLLRGNLQPMSFDSSDDSITAKGHPFSRLTYQAISALPQGSSPTFKLAELPFEARAAYLQLPGNNNRIFDLAKLVASEAQSVQEACRKIESYLQKNYSYSLEQSQLERPRPLATFLFESRRGHCEYFASAMVILLRTLGIPSRLVNGFRAGEYNAIGEDYVVRGRDAHSWVEAYSPEEGWQTFDPTPASNLTAAQHPFFATINNYLDAFELFWGEWILGYDDVAQVSLFRDLQERSTLWVTQSKDQLYRKAVYLRDTIFIQSQRGIAFVKKQGWKLPLACLIIGMGAWACFLLYQWLSWKLLLKKSTFEGNGAVATQFYVKMLRFLQSNGKAKPPSLTPIEFAETFANRSIRSDVEQLTQIYNAIRFSKNPVSTDQIRRVSQILSALKSQAKSGETII
jgi:protein-glutamine gamma-glutamyltransferase